jgi:hypothetical protein
MLSIFGVTLVLYFIKILSGSKNSSTVKCEISIKFRIFTICRSWKFYAGAGVFSPEEKTEVGKARF